LNAGAVVTTVAAAPVRFDQAGFIIWAIPINASSQFRAVFATNREFHLLIPRYDPHHELGAKRASPSGRPASCDRRFPLNRFCAGDGDPAGDPGADDTGAGTRTGSGAGPGACARRADRAR